VKIKKYRGNGESLLDMLEIVKSHLDSSPNNVLDLAGYKPPKAVGKLAKWYSDSQFDHFREDSIRIDKVSPEVAKISNLKVITSYRKLRPSYGFELSFFTLHELKNPKKSLRKSLEKVSVGGKFCCVDYDLPWFLDLAKKENWNSSTMRENFSKYLFVEGNECAVLGMANGKDLPKDKKNNAVIEVNCIKDHTNLGREDYLEIFSGLRLKKLDLVSYEIKTPWGEKPKQFLYIGEKVE